MMAFSGLDWTSIEELKSVDGGGKDSTLCEVLKMFLAVAENEIVVLCQAVKDNDVERVSHVAHKFKSSCNTVGAKAMGLICQKLESESKSGSLTSGDSDAKNLVESYATVKPQLDLLLQETLNTENTEAA